MQRPRSQPAQISWIHLVSAILALRMTEAAGQADGRPRRPSAFSATSDICDRASSRGAVLAFDTVIKPRLDALGYELPVGCPLDMSKDMFKVQEAHKTVVRSNKWRCTWDDKVFRGEAYIDAHMDRYHPLEADPEATACLADLCGSLHCDFFAAVRHGSTAHLRHAPCHEGTMAVHRAKCQDIAHVCFPPETGAAAEELHAFMQRSLCAAVTCRWSEREALLRPLGTNGGGDRYLRIVAVVSVLLILAVAYVIVFALWMNKTASKDNSVLRLLQRGRRRGPDYKLH